MNDVCPAPARHCPVSENITVITSSGNRTKIWWSRGKTNVYHSMTKLAQAVETTINMTIYHFINDKAKNRIRGKKYIR